MECVNIILRVTLCFWFLPFNGLFLVMYVGVPTHRMYMHASQGFQKLGARNNESEDVAVCRHLVKELEHFEVLFFLLSKYKLVI